MNNQQFAINDTVLDATDDIGAIAMRLWQENPDAKESDTPSDVAICFPNGITMAVSRFMGRTALDDAETETPEEYDELPITYSHLQRITAENI